MAEISISEILEIWKPVIGYEDYYEVSNLGRIKSMERFVQFFNKKGTFCKTISKERILIISLLPGGYAVVTFCVDSKRKTFLVHRLVGEAFIPNPKNKPEINHKNGVRNDNKVSNLEWNTRSENQCHSRRELGRKYSGSPLKPVMGISEKNEMLFFPSLMSATKAGFNRSHISMCIKGRGNRKQHKEYSWFYA